MYQRNEEMDLLLTEANKIPEELSMSTIQKRVTKKLFRHRVLVVSRNTTISFILLFAFLVIGVNHSKAFADSMSKLPFLEKLVESVSWNKGYQDAINYHSLTPVNQTVSTKYMDITLAYALCDEKNLVLFMNADSTKTSEDNRANLYNTIFTDEDTGEEIYFSSGSSLILSPDSYKAWSFSWGENYKYTKHLRIDITMQSMEKDYETTLTYHLTLDKPQPPKTYEVKHSFEVKGEKYTIDKVVCYPTCTLAEVLFDSDNQMDIVSANFSLVNQSGKKRGEIPNAFLHYFKLEDDTSFSKRELFMKRLLVGDGAGSAYEEIPNGIRYYLESGYFAFRNDEKLHLILDRIELLPNAKKEVKLNVNTLEFTDAEGIVKGIKNVKRDKSGNISFSIEHDTEWHYCTSFYIHVLADDSDYSMTSNVDSQIDEEGNIWYSIPAKYLKKRFQDGKDCITLYRSYPEYMVDLDLKIPLQ